MTPHPFRCGFTSPTYCPTHTSYPCHGDGTRPVGPYRECPGCRTARWASVNLDSRATPTRRER